MMKNKTSTDKWVTCMSFPEDFKRKLNKVQYLCDLQKNNYNDTIVFAVDKLLEILEKGEENVSN